MATAFDLRPLQFGEHLSRSFSIFLRHWVTLARWYLFTFFLPVAALMLLMHTLMDPYSFVAQRLEEPSMFKPSTSAAYWWGIRFLALGFAHWFAAGGLFYMASRIYVGDSPGFMETVRAVMRRAGHLTGTSFVYLLGLAGVLLVSYGPAWLMAQDSGRNPEVGAIMFAVFVSTPGAFLIGVAFLGNFGLSLACVMLDDADASSAFVRSRQLAKGFRWRLTMLVMVAGFITGVPGLWSLLDIPGMVARELISDSGFHLGADLAFVAWQGLLAPVFLLPVMVFFFDQRSRKEGYDLAVMARNFGIDEGQLLRFQMDPLLGYIPKGFKGERRRKLLPQAASQQASGWPASTGWPQQAQPWPQPQGQPWPQPQGQQWPQRQPQSPRPAQPRVFRPPPRKGGM